MAHMRAGGASLHDGRTWHGSGPNDSAAAPRRGLGIHFVPACATFAPGAELGKLWAPLKQPGTDALPDDLLPVTWVPSQQVQVPSQVPSGGEAAGPPCEAAGRPGRSSVTAAQSSPSRDSPSQKSLEVSRCRNSSAV